MRAFIDFAAVAAPRPANDTTSSTSNLSAGSDALQMVFGEPTEVLVAHQLDQVQEVLRAVHQRSLQGQWCVGFVRYEAAPAFDSALAVHTASGPLAWFGVHDAPLPMRPTRPAQYPRPQPPSRSAESPPGDQPRVTWQPGLARADFDHAMAQLLQAISDGEIYQANYTTRNVGQLHVPPLELFAAMRRAQPGGFAAYIDTSDEQVLSVSPELFFDWHNGHLLTRPMKGTAPRGRTAEEDAALEQALRNSPKERAENVMIVDLIRNDLSRLAQPFSVVVNGLCRTQALPTVWQMVTDVHADTRPGTTLWDVFAALFPCGSVTGAPKVQAMQWIRDVENSDRGVYCGAVGVVRPGGSATFNVPIRTAEVRGNVVRAGTGSGITADSQAAGEWQEWRDKQAFLRRASQSFDILETLALQNGVLRHEAAHLARMQQSAAHFAYPWDAHAVQQCLSDLRLQHPNGNWRVRLLLNEHGRIAVQAFALHATPRPLRLQLAAEPLQQAHSEFVRHKTTRRAHYDKLAPTDPSVFDTVLWNAAGEVTECTRGNVAFLLDGQWVTPSLASGLLPGIGRAHWLAKGRIEESVVRVSDLPRVVALAFVNSLRGWLPAEWAHRPLQQPPD